MIDGVDFDLAELRALMDRAALFIGGDSGPLHVAGTTGVPIVGLYGPTLAARSAPWRPARFVTESIEVPDLAVPPVRPAALRAGRLPVPGIDRARHGGRGRRACAGADTVAPYGERTRRRNASPSGSTG